jgi:hypothetical protein
MAEISSFFLDQEWAVSPEARRNRGGEQPER